MGRLLGEFVDREARLVTPALRRDLQVLLSERRASWSVYGSASPDGEETANFFDAWPDIAKCLGIRPSTAKYKAIADMWDLLQALYCTYQGPNQLNCAAVARDFQRQCTAGTASWYLLSLEQDVDTMLQNIKPFGLAMFSGDISESINRFLKHGHNEHSNRGAMRQRKLGSHTPPCHRRMVITTLLSVLLAALQRRIVLYRTRWLLTVLWSFGR